jgi:hypothetical protein
MRRVALIGTTALLICAAAATFGIVWVDRAIAAAQAAPSIVCLAPAVRREAVAGVLPLDEQDRLVGMAINFNAGTSRRHSSWHLRGTAILLTYRIFWSKDRRRTIFSRVASQMQDCPRSMR